MYYQIYLDSLLIQEVIINFYVLELCKICLMSSVTHKRLILTSLVAGSLQTLLFLLTFPTNLFWFYMVLISWYVMAGFITVRIGFGKNPVRIYIKQMSIYMIFMLIIGGMIMGILPRFSFYKNSKVKLIFFLMVGAGVYILVWKVFKEKRSRDYNGQLQFSHRGKSLEGSYFMDSGNGLRESLSGKPVLLADDKWFFGTYSKESFFCRPVVYKSVGKEKGILYAYCLDELVILGKDKTYIYEKVWVGVCREDIFADKDYQIILPPEYGVHNE